jgi:hypothetical protein
MPTPNAFTRNLKDADLIKTIALPADAGAVVTAGIDTGLRTARAIMPDVEFEIKIPAIAVGIAPNTVTLVAEIQMDSDPDFGSPTTIETTTFTASGGAGIPAQNYRHKVPETMERYVRAKFTGADVGEEDFGNASALTASFAILASSRER